MTSLYVVITDFENSSLPTSSGVSGAFNYSQTINIMGQLTFHGTCPLSGLQNFIGVSMPDILTTFSGTSISDIYIQAGGASIQTNIIISDTTYVRDGQWVNSEGVSYNFNVIETAFGGSLGNFTIPDDYALLKRSVNNLPYEIKIHYIEDFDEP